MRALEEFLKKQNIVKSYEFFPEAENLAVWFHDDPEVLYDVGLFMYVRDRNKARSFVKDDVENERRRAQEGAESYRKKIEQGLSGNGVLLVPCKGKPKVFMGKDAERVLGTISTALKEILRQRDCLQEALFGDVVQEKTDWATEMILNLRFRELLERCQHESATGTTN